MTVNKHSELCDHLCNMGTNIQLLPDAVPAQKAYYNLTEITLDLIIAGRGMINFGAECNKHYNLRQDVGNKWHQEHGPDKIRPILYETV